jgi:hypothetical protein
MSFFIKERTASRSGHTALCDADYWMDQFMILRVICIVDLRIGGFCRIDGIKSEDRESPMVTSGVLASIKVRHIIFHDVPKTNRGNSGTPTLADAETILDATRSAMLKDRLIKVLGSKSAYPIEFEPTTTSIVPAEVRQFTTTAFSAAKFVAMSRLLAQHLYDKQDGTISAGLLCVIDVAVSGLPGVALLKLEREQGAELQWKEEAGKKAVHMSVLDNLVLTDGTRLFKSAMFVMKDVALEHAVACDS